MSKGGNTLTATIIASVIGVVGAVVTNYYVTQDTIEAKFNDWQDRLEITAREDERRSQVEQLTAAQEAFHVHINHLKLSHRIAFNFYLNEAIITHQPLFAFGGLSDQEIRTMINSLEENINDAHQRRFQLDQEMAVSDARFKATLETVLFRHHDDCVSALSPVPLKIELEMNEIEAFFDEISPYISSQSQISVSRAEFMALLSSSEKYQAAFDFDAPISEFTGASESCHDLLEAGFSSSPD